MLISEFKSDATQRDHGNNTAISKAAEGGHVETVQALTTELGCSSEVTGFHGVSLLHLACFSGSIKLAEVLITDFGVDIVSVDDSGNTPLHMACWGGHEELARLLITKYNCPVDAVNKNNHTPLHIACWIGHSTIVKMLVSEFKANLMARDHENDTPINKAALNGHEDTVKVLITELGCSSQIKGFKDRLLLHQACQNRNTLTAAMLLQEFPTLIYSTDNDGNSPLHFSSLLGKAAHVRLLLFDYHAPVFIRNKAGRTTIDLAKDKAIKKIFEEYMSSEHKSIQQEYKKLQVLSSLKYSGPQTITRVFVLGNPGSGKSTLVESLKRKGIIYPFFRVSEADVPLHTAGIVPSVDQSNAYRLLYYDFAGDSVYYSSHAAILEMISHSNVGTNVFLLLVNLTKGNVVVCDEIGYWLSFISYHGKAIDSQQKLKVIIVLSHVDHLSQADASTSLATIRQYIYTLINQGFQKIIKIIDIVSFDCRYPRSSKVTGNILQDIAKNIPPSVLSFKTALLHGMLIKDFGNVVACKFQDLLSHIKDTGIQCLPTSAGALYPRVKELHDIGLLMMIGRGEDQIENHLLLMDVPSLTNEVHQLLFSESARENLTRAAGSKYAKMGLFSESFISGRLPNHITKDCLVQLQYCQEFKHADVGLDYSVTRNPQISNVLLYFPALCQLETEHSNWPHDPNLDFSIGWFTECIGKLDYFPPRFLHVLLLRLTFIFALPASSTPMSDLDLGINLQDQNYHCTMWKKAIHWIMREGVECIVEVVNENKGVVVIVKSRKQHIYQCIHMLTQIANVVTGAKTEFCNSVFLRHYILDSNDPSSYSNEDKLYDVNLIKSAMENKDEVVRSASGHQTLTLESLKFIHVGVQYSVVMSSAFIMS
jgi:ankyrin repeat protein